LIRVHHALAEDIRSTPFITKALDLCPSHTHPKMSEIMKEIQAGRERWPKGIDTVDNTTTTTIKDIDDYITFKITEYTHYNVHDEDLWEVFKEDFKGFSLIMLKECSQLGIRKLRTLLRMNGVWVRKDRRMTVAESLYNTLQEEDPIEWTMQEIEEHIRTEGQFNSVPINHILSQDNKLAGPTHARTTALPDLPGPLDSPELHQHTQSVSGEPEQLASREQSTFGKELANLAKMYTDESKYSGENDNFDYKLVIFHDICSRVDIPDSIKAKAYPTMLRGLALDHYYKVSRELSRHTTSPLIRSATPHAITSKALSIGVEY
jgi:hypothetical protein